ncbi:MAG: ATP-dependent DNA helicase [Candidatus ainarchaeum sp.]|jgi:DNA excision repair protein ERCC-2|nr:ATP-dependent DNA helicase [Candidatus ainarchaeum sp.]
MPLKKIYFRHSSFREGQKQIIIDILEAFENRKNIILHAPTGTGKTDASLSAAISYAIEHDKKILFLTPKTSQHKIALEVIREINFKYNLGVKAIDFVGKRNLCIEPGISQVKAGFYEVCKNACMNKQCPFYNNVRPANKTEREITEQLIERENRSLTILSAENSRNISYDFKNLHGKPAPLCPYEFSKIFARTCQIIIADYNHLFSKKISSTFLAEINVDIKDCIVIVDEAHNLEERIIKLLSKTINLNIINRAIKEAEEIDEKNVESFLKDFVLKLEEIAHNKFKDKKSLYEKEEFVKENEIISEKYIKDIEEKIIEIEEAGISYIEKKNETRSSLVTVALFLESWFLIKEKDFVKYIKIEKNVITLKNNALDVSTITKEVFKNCFSSVIMSGTLTPLSMYEEIYGIKDNSVLKEYDSPFLKENRLDILINNVTTKFTNRNIDEYKKIGDITSQIVNSIPGNTVVFFPSFEMMRDIEKYIKINKPKIYQLEESTTDDFEKMINDFKDGSRLLGSCLFAVMGGKASEGIDLPGNLLLGAVIIGIPLSKLEIYTKARIEYYDKLYKKGWQYAYIQPAIQKVIQSAGRVIRSEKDRGVVFYLDSRYEWDNYKRHIPKNIKFIKTKEYKEEILKFFS